MTFFNERYPVDQYVVDLRSELYALNILAPHYRSQMWPAETHYPVKEFQNHVILQLIVCQLACLFNYHVAEYLVVDVAVQLYQLFRTTESRAHLKEQQGHFPFRSKERLASQLRTQVFPYQTEVLCHLAEMEQLLYPAQFALFKRRSVDVIKN